MKSELILETLKKPYLKTTIFITITIIIILTATQSLWIDPGISAIYQERSINDIKYMIGQTYVVKGYYDDSYIYDIFDKSNIAYVVITNDNNCNIKNSIVKLLVVNEETLRDTEGSYKKIKFNLTNKKTGEDIPRIVLLKVLDGCE